MKIHRHALLLPLILAAIFSAAADLRSQVATKSAASAASLVLTDQDKNLLQEALRLKRILGDEVWPGLGEASIPVILYNNSYQFLIGSANPPPPPWFEVEEDAFSGQTYFRRPDEKPQAFAVEIGEEWAGSMSTLDQLAGKTPLKITPDFYVVLLLHEVFHAFQADEAPARFQRASALYALESTYPAKVPEFAKAWTTEGALLARALKAKDRAEIVDAVRAFLENRRARRGLITTVIGIADYEREMEWLEGLGKYAEIRFYELAADRDGEPAFANYKPGLPYWTWDFVRLEKQLGAQKGDLRFYLSGMAQARILDRLSPDWKASFFKEGGAMEDRLQALVEAQ
jgi:hypothetical protein